MARKRKVTRKQWDAMSFEERTAEHERRVQAGEETVPWPITPMPEPERRVVSIIDGRVLVGELEHRIVALDDGTLTVEPADN